MGCILLRGVHVNECRQYMQEKHILSTFIYMYATQQDAPHRNEVYKYMTFDILRWGWPIEAETCCEKLWEEYNNKIQQLRVQEKHILSTFIYIYLYVSNLAYPVKGHKCKSVAWKGLMNTCQSSLHLDSSTYLKVHFELVTKTHVLGLKIDLWMCQQAIQCAVHIWDGLHNKIRAEFEHCNWVSGQQMLAKSASQIQFHPKDISLQIDIYIPCLFTIKQHTARTEWCSSHYTI
jgi:hypothetical protein